MIGVSKRGSRVDTSIMAQPLYEEGARAADLAQKKPVSYLNTIPAKVITKDDLAPYYKILDGAGQ